MLSRLTKVLAHYDLYKSISNLPGDIVECGVFKGVSLARFAIFRELLSNSASRKIIGFDVFGKYPETSFTGDQEMRDHFIQVAGEESISKQQLIEVLEHKGVGKNVDLIEGDITTTVPVYVAQHPELRLLYSISIQIFMNRLLQYWNTFSPRLSKVACSY